MQGQYSNHAPYYRCRYPREYALASHVRHPGNVYLREADLLPAIDSWLLVIFAPHRLEQTIREMQEAQDLGPGTTRLALPAEDTQALIADCDARLARNCSVEVSLKETVANAVHHATGVRIALPWYRYPAADLAGRWPAQQPGRPVA